MCWLADCISSMGVVCSCVVSQFTFVCRLRSSIGVCTSVVNQFAFVSNLRSSMGVCTCVVLRWEDCVLVL